MLEQIGDVSEVPFEISRFIFYDFSNTYPYVFNRQKQIFCYIGRLGIDNMQKKN
jgi:hypothetical protein